MRVLVDVLSLSTLALAMGHSLLSSRMQKVSAMSKAKKRRKKKAKKIILIEGHRLNRETGQMEPVCIKLKWYG